MAAPHSFKANPMNMTPLLITLAIALPVTALAAWIWIIVDRVDREFSAELQGIHFDI
jgi:hypothetical protein